MTNFQYKTPGPNWKPRTKADYIKLIRPHWLQNRMGTLTELNNKDKAELKEIHRQINQSIFIGMMRK